MALTFQQILTDAGKLVSDMATQENAADSLLCEIQSVYTQVDSMKQYQEDVETLNLQTNQKSREEIINNFQKGNVGYFRELQAENRDLRNALQDYQNALELIMSKYRQQTAYFLRESKSQKCKNDTNCCNVKQCDCEKIIQKQAKRINEMASVMRTAAKLDEEQECNYLEVIGQYKEENLALREMMDVANKFGSKYNNSIPLESKNVQTDEVSENSNFKE